MLTNTWRDELTKRNLVICTLQANLALLTSAMDSVHVLHDRKGLGGARLRREDVDLVDL